MAKWTKEPERTDDRNLEIFPSGYCVNIHRVKLKLFANHY